MPGNGFPQPGYKKGAKHYRGSQGSSSGASLTLDLSKGYAKPPPKGFNLSPLDEDTSLYPAQRRETDQQKYNRSLAARAQRHKARIPKGFNLTLKNVGTQVLRKNPYGRIIEAALDVAIDQGIQALSRAGKTETIAASEDWSNWTIKFDCGAHNWPNGKTASSCNLLQTVSKTSWDNNWTPAPVVALGIRYYCFASSKVDYFGSYWRIRTAFEATQNASIPYVDPIIPASQTYSRSIPTPRAHPMWHRPTWAFGPMVLPINQSIGVPQPMPWRIVPYRIPSTRLVDQTETGPAPEPKTDAGSSNWRGITGAGKTMRPTRGPHLSRPPYRRTKEKKLVLAIAAKTVLAGALSSITETSDVVWVLYRALPRNRQHFGRDKKLSQKLATIFLHFYEIDGNKAVRGIIYNQIEDMIYGKIGKKLGQANKNLEVNFLGKLFGQDYGLGVEVDAEAIHAWLTQ